MNNRFVILGWGYRVLDLPTLGACFCFSVLSLLLVTAAVFCAATSYAALMLSVTSANLELSWYLQQCLCYVQGSMARGPDPDFNPLTRTLTLTLKHVTWRVFRKLRRSWPWRHCVSWASRGRGEPVAPGCLVDRRAKWCYRLSLAWLEQGLLWSTRLLKRMRQIEALEAEHEESCNYEDGVCEWPRVRARFPFTYKQATFSRCFRTSSLGPAPGKCFATAALYHRRYESSADLLLLSKPWHTRMCCLHSFPSLDVMWILRSE